jgi:hypothetical protein
MANALYPKWKEAIIQGTTGSSLGGTVKAVLVDTGLYTYSAAHQYLNSVTSTATAGTAQTINNKTFVNGLFKGDNVTFTGVPAGTSTGTALEAIILYIDSGSTATSPLVAYFDTATGLAVTPNGGDITISWNASGIFQL